MGDQRQKSTFDELIQARVLEIGDGYRAKNSELGGDGPIFLRAGHVKDTHIDFTGVDRFRRDLTNKVNGKMSRPGDVVITTKGNSTGRVAWVDESLPSFVYSPHLSYWRSLDSARLDPGFLRYWSRSEEFHRQLRAMSASTDMALYLSLVDQRRLVLDLPSIEEQRSIGRVLAALDDKIELNRRMNETLEAMARTLFRSWFLDFDPVRAKMEGRAPAGMDRETGALFPDSFEESELGEIPRGWSRCSVGDLVTLKRGKTYQGMLVGQPGPALLGLGSIVPGGGFRRDAFKTYGGDCPPELTLVPGDLYVSLKGATKDGEMIGSIARVPSLVPRGRLTQDTVKLELRDARVARYLCRALLTPEYRAYCANRATGSAVVGLSREDFLAYPLHTPGDDVLERFNTVVIPLEDLQERRWEENGTLAQLRDLLLPKLLSGELRVKDAEKQLEAVA